MRCVTYNIQYGIGLDGRYDLGRIAGAVRGADVIALQEVTRNFPTNGGRDMVAELRDLLPDYFAVYGAPFEIEMGSAIEDGRAVDRRLQFGNMVLSRTPIFASRNHLLPRGRTIDLLNLQRGALEALIGTPFGPIRFYCVHLDHTSATERIAQVARLLECAKAFPMEGGAVTGAVEFGFPEPPLPEAYVLMGDFNFTPGSPEYQTMTGLADREFGHTLRSTHPADAARLAGAPADRVTWIDPRKQDDRTRDACLDHVFVEAGLARHVRDLRIDAAAVGSDHKPIWVEFA